MSDTLNQVVGLIIQIADQIGIQGSRLWPEIVQYTFAIALVQLLGSLLFVVISAVCIYGGVRLCRKGAALDAAMRDKGRNPGDDNCGYYFVGGTLAILAGIGAFVALLNALMAIPTLMSPEAATVMQLLARGTGK